MGKWYPQRHDAKTLHSLTSIPLPTIYQYGSKKKSITVDIFQDIIRKEWEGIELEIFTNLIKSMPSRLEQIIKGNGNKINY